MQVYGDIQNILKNLNAEIEQEINSIINEAKEYAENRLKQAEREAIIRKRRILKDAEKKKEVLRRKILSNLILEINRINLRKQQQIINQILEKLQQQIEDFRKKPGYKDFIKELVNEAASNIDDKEIVIIFDEHDKNILDKNFIKSLITSLKKHGYKVSEKNIEFSPYLGGGVIIRSINKPLLYNNTLKSRFNRMKEMLILKIYDTLLKEWQQHITK